VPVENRKRRVISNAARCRVYTNLSVRVPCNYAIKDVSIPPQWNSARNIAVTEMNLAPKL